MKQRTNSSNQTWRDQSACRGLDPDIFYPSGDEDSPEGKAVCEACPVRQPCLEHALATREAEGIWGGLNPRERRRVIRQRRKTAAA